MERWTRFRQRNLVFYEEQNLLTPGQAGEIQAQLAEIRAVLAQLRDDLDIEPRIVSIAQSIQATCGALWQHLEELEVMRLQRYGEVPQELTENVQPRLAELIDRLKRISSIIGAPRDRGAGTSSPNAAPK